MGGISFPQVELAGHRYECAPDNGARGNFSFVGRTPDAERGRSVFSWGESGYKPEVECLHCGDRLWRSLPNRHPGLHPTSSLLLLVDPLGDTRYALCRPQRSRPNPTSMAVESTATPNQ